MQRLYEAMFVVDANRAKEGYEKLEADCLACVTRHGGEIVKAIKWDEKRLAYEIGKVRRGTYILVHFNAEGDAIAKIERQCQLSETVLRVMITQDVDGVETETGSARERAEAATATDSVDAGESKEKEEVEVSSDKE